MSERMIWTDEQVESHLDEWTDRKRARHDLDASINVMLTPEMGCLSYWLETPFFTVDLTARQYQMIEHWICTHAESKVSA